jgi:putative spermidine/putrescine transport system permease protein
LFPLASLLWGSFQGVEGRLTLANYGALAAPLYYRSLINSLLLSAVTALGGAALGTLTAALLLASRSRTVRDLVTTLCAVSANFAGVPLAFAFMSMIGISGWVTVLFRQAWGLSLYPTVSLYSWTGLAFVYLYFQIPLMALTVLPAMQGLKPEWREAVANLGGSGVDFWRHVGLPVLTPALLGGFVLLFANSFGAYATAYALATGRLSLLPIQVGMAISGNVSYEPGQASAVAAVMVVVMGACIWFYRAMGKKVSQWVS